MQNCNKKIKTSFIQAQHSVYQNSFLRDGFACMLDLDNNEWIINKLQDFTWTK